jgi:hypothetical protein
MILRTRPLLTSPGAPRLARLLLALLLPALVALPLSSASAEITYQHESLQEYEKQLAGGQIAAVTINKKTRSVHVTLKDGRYVLAKYPAKTEPTVIRALQAKHVPVNVLSKAAADKEAKKHVHHKLRYIAGGIVIAVIVIVAIVLVVDRRRKALRD